MQRQSAAPQVKMKPTPKRTHVEVIIEKLVIGIGTWVIPPLLAVWFLVSIWQTLSNKETPEGVNIPISVWYKTDISASETPAQALAQLQLPQNKSTAEYASTHLSTLPHWFALKASAPKANAPWAITFPSRHAMQLSCWNQEDLELIGSANRAVLMGAFTNSQGGFALNLPASSLSMALLCRSTFEGPARISALLWHASDLDIAETDHQKKGALIEGSVGVLALFMIMLAIINRNSLYAVFFAWLLLSMRMASISVGADFQILGYDLAPSLLFPMRQWTATLYYTLGIALFSYLFRDELAKLGARRGLAVQQLSALLILPICAFASYKNILTLLWGLTGVGIFITGYYLIQILRQHVSRTVIWYALSILISWVSALSEVLAAATGLHSLRGLNSVTAAIASALFSSLAVAEHLQTERRAKLKSQMSLKTAYEESPIGLFTVNSDGTLINCNPRFRTKLAGFNTKKGVHLATLFEAHVHEAITVMHMSPERAPVELQTRVHAAHTHDMNDRWFAIHVSVSEGDLVEGTLQDITEKVQAMDRLEFLANHDPLTHCLNLRGLTQHFVPGGTLPQALVYFDLDRFKLINDLYGHVAGDAVLQQVCQRIKSQLGHHDVLARVGGDEFVIAFPMDLIEIVKERCLRIVALIAATPYLIETQSFTLSISGGLVETARFGTPALKALISYADTACRLAKKRTTQRLLTVESKSSLFKHHQDGLDIAASLERGKVPEGLFLVMQPEMSLAAPFDSLNFEVLLRLRKSNGDIVPAQVIIEAAEAHGKSALIDRWVVTTTLQWLETHAQQLTKTQFVGVNLSGGSLNDERFTEELFALFERYRTALPLVCLEITETVALTDITNMQRFIDRARAMGAKVGLDDFGAGYSSFGYLKDLSVDALKLDGSLVKDAANYPTGTAIVMAIGGLAKSLGIKSIGEFAEDLSTVRMLVSAGVDYAQGYGISKPVMPERILTTRSSADFIEDPSLREYAQQLQSQSHDNPPDWLEEYLQRRLQ